MIAPQSDGGPGFVEVLAGQLGETRRLRVSGPLDTPVEAVVFDSAVEDRLPGVCAGLRPGLARRPAHAGNRAGGQQQGVGQLIAEALRSGARRIVVAGR